MSEQTSSVTSADSGGDIDRGSVYRYRRGTSDPKGHCTSDPRFPFVKLSGSFDITEKVVSKSSVQDRGE